MAKATFHGSFGSKAAARQRLEEVLARAHAGELRGEIRPSTLRGAPRFTVVTRATNPRRRSCGSDLGGGSEGSGLVELLLVGGLVWLGVKALTRTAAAAAQPFDEDALAEQREGEREEF